jgi:Ribbon-helix-helix protein, copG family
VKKSVFFRLTEKELDILDDYCLESGRSKSDVLRELIRKLKNKKPSQKDGACIPFFWSTKGRNK